MSGKPKKGLEWAGWDVHIFEDSERIDELIDAQAWTGFSIYFYLCQKAYATNGYFYRWNYTNAATTARKMGGGVKSETVKQVVSLCLRIGLFDSELFDRESILTNRDIQERYMIAVEKRSENGRTVDPKYWLLNSEETRAYIIIPQNNNSLPENAYNLPENTTKESKVKESKVKESKVCYRIPARNGEYELTEDTYNKLTHTYEDMDIDKSIGKFIKYLNANPEKQRFKNATEKYLILWVSEDDNRCLYRKQRNYDNKKSPEKDGYSASYDLEAYENTSALDEEW